MMSGFKGLKPILYGGHEVWPLIEGGKGVAATNHRSSGAWAAAGGIGTVSAVNADSYDPAGKIVRRSTNSSPARNGHEQLIRYAIDGAVEQVRGAYDIAGGNGAININVLWEMGGAQPILEAVLEQTRGLVAGVTCGAGHALQAFGNRGQARGQLPADRLFGPGVSGAVEAGLPQGARTLGRSRL